jgi:hypothetical protein
VLDRLDVELYLRVITYPRAALAVYPVNFGGVALKKKLLPTVVLGIVLSLVNVPSASAGCACTWVYCYWFGCYDPLNFWEYDCGYAPYRDYCILSSDRQSCIDYGGGCVPGDPACNC